MSRVGKAPIAVPAKVTVTVEKDNLVTVSGPKGALTQKFDPDMTIAVENGQIKVTRPTDQREHRAQHGLTRALLNNMVTGVTTGFTRKLEIQGVGYKAEKRGDNLVLSVGKSHPVEFVPPSKDITFDGGEGWPFVHHHRHRQGRRWASWRRRFVARGRRNPTRARASATRVSTCVKRRARPARSARNKEN